MLIAADLPDDPHALRAMLVERDRQITVLEEVKELAQAKLARLGAIIAALQRYRLGARSEQLHPDQLLLALQEVDAAVGRIKARLDAVAAEPNEVRPRHRNRDALPAHLEQLVDVEGKRCACYSCPRSRRSVPGCGERGQCEARTAARSRRPSD